MLRATGGAGGNAFGTRPGPSTSAKKLLSRNRFEGYTDWLERSSRSSGLRWKRASLPATPFLPMANWPIGPIKCLWSAPGSRAASR